MNPVDFVQENQSALYRGEQMKDRVRLEQEISSQGRDAILFPDLQAIHMWEKKEPWMAGLTFPEKLLNKEKTWKDYDLEALSPKHVLFVRLRQYIDAIGGYNPQERSIASSLSKVQKYYQRYMQECCLAEGKQRRRLLKGPARLSGFLQGEPVCKEVDQKVARRLVSINRFNEETRTNAFGASSVFRDAVGNVFYKRARANPLRPGQEFAFDAFNNLFLGGRATPTKLLKLEDVVCRDFFGKTDPSNALRAKLQFDWYEAKNKQSNLLYSDFIRQHPEYPLHPFEEKKRNFLIQASLGIRGEELHTFLTENSSMALGAQICPYNYSAMVVLALILRTNDGRADNYMLEEGDVGKREIVGIDNDGILSAPVTKVREEYHMIALRSTLLLFPELMSAPFDRNFVKDFTSLNLEKKFISYLRELEKYNLNLEPFRSSHILSEADIGSLSLPVQLSFESFSSLYTSAKTLQAFLRENPKGCGNDLFKTLFPIVYEAYQVTLHEKSPLEAQNCFFNPAQSQSIEDILQKSFGEVEQETKQLPGMESGNSLSISELLPRFLDTVLPTLDGKRQEQLINHTHKTFRNFKHQCFKGIKFSDSVFAEVIEKGQVQELFLEESEEITPEGIIVLLNDYPRLKLILGKNKQFTPESMTKLIEAAQKMKRSLFYRIRNTDYLISGNDFNQVIYPAIEYGHFVLAEAIIKKFPVNFAKSDKEGNTFFHLVAKRGSPQAVRFLVETCGFPLMISNLKGQTAFHLAAEGGNIRALETLIHLEGPEGKGLSQKDANGRTPFHVATYAYNEAMAFLLHEILTHRLPQGELVHLEKDPEGYTPLHIAAKFGLHEEVTSLIERHHMGVNIRGQNERTPLHMACYNGRVETAKVLLQKGADINAQADEEDGHTTPLHDAVTHRDLAVVNVLIESERLNVNLQNKKNLSPIDIAAMDGNLPILRLLLNHPSCQGKEEKLESWIANAKKYRHWHLLPFLYSEQSLVFLNKMAPEERAPEAQRIIEKLQGLEH